MPGSGKRCSNLVHRDNWRGPDWDVVAPGSTAPRGLFHVVLLQGEFFNAIADLIAVQTEQRRGARLIAVRALERLHDEAALDLLQIDAFRRQLESTVTGRTS